MEIAFYILGGIFLISAIIFFHEVRHAKEIDPKEPFFSDEFPPEEQ